MRISSQSAEMVSRPTLASNSTSKDIVSEMAIKEVQDIQIKQLQVQTQMSNTKAREESKEEFSKEQLEKAVKAMNDVIDSQHKASKFVFHEGLDKYYVKLVDSKTEEVIKEIPPERLLDAFYEMQKLAGMIVDEKI